MGHYAKVESGIVTQVVVADGPDWCEKNLGGESLLVLVMNTTL